MSPIFCHQLSKIGANRQARTNTHLNGNLKGTENVVCLLTSGQFWPESSDSHQLEPHSVTYLQRPFYTAHGGRNFSFYDYALSITRGLQWFPMKANNQVS